GRPERRSAGDSLAHSARDHRRARHLPRQLAGGVVQEVHVAMRAMRSNHESLPMTTRLPRLITPALAALAMATPLIPVSGQMPARAPRYAITNAKIVTVAGPVIEKGTVVLRDGIIEDVGAAIAAPPDALVV